MRPRFQADADFNQKIVAGLRRREPAIDFRSARDGGVIGRPDPEVLAQAASDDRVLVSHDRQTMPGHFRRLIETSASPGLVIVSQDLDIGQAIEELLLVWAASEAEEWENTVIFLAAVISGSGSGGGGCRPRGFSGNGFESCSGLPIRGAQMTRPKDEQSWLPTLDTFRTFAA